MGYSYRNNKLTGAIELDGTIAGRDIAADGAALDQVVTDVANIDPVLATLSKSFVANEQHTITLASSVNSPSVAVTKEVPQVGVSSGRWGLSDNWGIEDTAPAVTLTWTDATHASIPGGFVAADVGKLIIGNGGIAILKDDTTGAVHILQSFTDLSPISAGDWAFNYLHTANSEIAMEGFSDFTQEVSGAVYDGVSVTDYALNNYLGAVAVSADGSTLYIGVAGSTLTEVKQYTLSTPYVLSSRGAAVSTAMGAWNKGIIFVSADGTKVINEGNGNATCYNLSTPYDFTSGSVVGGAVTFSTMGMSNGATGASGLTLNDDGTKMLVINSNRYIDVFTLSTPYDLSSASLLASSTQLAYPGGNFRSLALIENDTILILGVQNVGARQYDITDPWTAPVLTFSSSSTLDGNMGSSDSLCVAGNKLYCTKMSATNWFATHQFTMFPAISAAPTNVWHTAVSTLSQQIDTDYWTDINSMVVTQDLQTESSSFALSLDNKATFFVLLEGSGARNTVRNNAGTWEFNSNATYGSETWTAATQNDVYGAFKEALLVSANVMSASQLQAVQDATFPALTSTLDVAVSLFTDTGTNLPSVQEVAINYDANTLNEMAEPGVDYIYDQPAADKIRIESLKDQNLKVRIV